MVSTSNTFILSRSAHWELEKRCRLRLCVTNSASNRFAPMFDAFDAFDALFNRLPTNKRTQLGGCSLWVSSRPLRNDKIRVNVVGRNFMSLEWADQTFQHFWLQWAERYKSSPRDMIDHQRWMEQSLRLQRTFCWNLLLEHRVERVNWEPISRYCHFILDRVSWGERVENVSTEETSSDPVAGRCRTPSSLVFQKYSKTGMQIPTGRVGWCRQVYLDPEFIENYQ